MYFYFLLLLSLSACKTAQDSSAKAEKDSNWGSYWSAEEKFEVNFLSNAFDDGMDENFHGNRKFISFESTTGGLKFKCPQGSCKLTIDGKSTDFVAARYRSVDDEAGFQFVLNNFDSQTFYEKVLIPWSTIKPDIQSVNGLDVVTEEKLIFLNYDKIGRINCQKKYRQTDSEKPFYACWFQYKGATNISKDYTDQSRGDEDKIWLEFEQELKSPD